MSKPSYPIRNAMLMAAGLGTRMLPFTKHRTKALLPVLGIPIAQYGIDSLVRAGVEQIVANVHHQSHESSLGLSELDFGNSKLLISDESRHLLGSAGGIRKAISCFEGLPFYLANADVLCDVDWLKLAACHQQLRQESKVKLTLAVYKSGPSSGKYREIRFDSAKRLITGLGELAEGKPFFIGAAVLEPEAFLEVPDRRPSDFVQSVLSPAIKQGRAGVYLCEGHWLDIGEPKLWLKSHLALIDMLESATPSVGVTAIWKERILKENLMLSKGVWTSRDSAGKQSFEGVAPCYWNPGYAKEENECLQVRRLLGPEAVLYGSWAEGKKYSKGIGFAGEWFNL